MPDYSYITRSLLGLGPNTNFRYKNGFAVGVNVETAASSTVYYNIVDPSHILMAGAGTTTNIYLPGEIASQGSLVDGLFYTIKNIANKGGSAGANFTLYVKGKINNSTATVIELKEQDVATVVYSDSTNTWYILSHYSEW